MFYVCYGKLSRAVHTMPVYVSFGKKYSLAMGRMGMCPKSTKLNALVATNSFSSSLLSSDMLLPSPTLSPPRSSYACLMRATSSYQGMNLCTESAQLWRASYTKLGYSMLSEKVSNGSTFTCWRSFRSMLSSVGAMTTEADTPKIVVVVESPAKANAVQRFLGSDFVVLPSHGHVRDLAGRAGSVRPDDDYVMLWEVPGSAQPYVARIKSACESAKCLVLAMDPDREGEALAWHVMETIKAEGIKKTASFDIQRVVFTEVTRKAVLFAMQDPQQIRLSLANAYLAQRALDYLVGFALSPLLWRKLAGSRSAGLVPLAALQLVCDREKAIEEFVPQAFWTLDVCFADEITSLSLYPVSNDGNKLQELPYFADKAKCLAIAEKLRASTLKVSNITRRFKPKDPPEPYRTSTLQEDAQAMLGFEVGQTMALAQKLYEGVNLGKGEFTGLITYPRTDGSQLSKKAARSIHAIAAHRFGNEYIPPNAREFKSLVKNMEEPHEAIRPTDMQRFPSALSQMLDKDFLALYTLIWKRTIESQMEQAMYEEVSIDFITEDEAKCLRTNVSHLRFPGFLAALEDKETSSIEAAWLLHHPEYKDLGSESWDMVSVLKEGDMVPIKKAEAVQHFTSAPARYSEGLLVKAMKEAGIGRPSTYSLIVKTLKARKFVRTDCQRIIPEVQGRMVSSFLFHHLSKFVDCSITAIIEKKLDEVSGGHLKWKEVLRGFWPGFIAEVSSVMNLSNRKVAEALHEAVFTSGFANLGFKGNLCPRCGTGRLSLRENHYGRGYYVGCDGCVCSFRARVIGDEPDESTTVEKKTSLCDKAKDTLLGLDPATNLELRVRSGPFGSYLQLGDEEKGLQCFNLPHDAKADEITMEEALKLTKYPRELGKHPEDGYPVILGINKKSYFLRHRSTRAALSKKENVEEMTLEQAIKLLMSRRKSQKDKDNSMAIAQGGKGERSSQTELMVLAPQVKAKKPSGRKKRAMIETGKAEENRGVSGIAVRCEAGVEKGEDTPSEMSDENGLCVSAR